MHRLTFLLSIFLPLSAQSTPHGHWAIPLDGSGRPANDLLYRGQVLTSTQALELSTQGIDLSKLQPQNSAVWSSGPILSPESLTIAETSTVDFSDVILSNRGVLRFNVHHPQDNNIYTIYLDKRAHITLLRAALLSRLGYRLPPMKHLKKLSVSFPSRERRDNFLSRDLPLATLGAASRWIGLSPEQLHDDQLTIEFQDVIAFLPKESDHYNLAMGVPPKFLASRTLRALLLPYALLFADESINKISWNVGRKLNDTIILEHFVLSDMGTTLDDALWILEKMAQLTREDFMAIAAEAALPPPAAILMTEKMIARRNSLMALFSIPAPPLEVNPQISSGKELVDGKLTQTRWEGYASHFAYPDADSPFKDFEYLGYSILQSSALTSLFSRINQELKFFDITKKRKDALSKQFTKSFNHYIDTGEVKDISMKTWHSPVFNINLIANRNVVFGHYLGTENMVQMTDILGFSVDAGGLLGIENDNAFTSSIISAKTTFLKTYVHVRPLSSLKKVFQEPYSKMLIPLTKGELADNFEMYKSNPDSKKILEQINTLLPVGESLIITESVVPQVSATLGGYVLVQGAFKLKASAEMQTLRRLHIHRKSAQVINIYDDRGNGHKFSLGGNYSRYIPIFSTDEKRHNGNYEIKFFQIDIDNNLEKNPDFHKNIAGLYQVMTEGSTEILNENANAWIVDAKFHDEINNTNFLLWKSKSFDGELNFHVKKLKPDAHKLSAYNYLDYTKGRRSGLNHESFLKDVANYYLTDWMKGEDFTFQLENNPNTDPGQTIYGTSETLLSSYRAKKHHKNTHHESPRIVLSQKKRGFSINKNSLLNYIESVNKQYSETIFDPYSLGNLKGLWLYDLNVVTAIHTPGIEKMKRLKDNILYQLQNTYTQKRYNRPECRHRSNITPTSQNLIFCGNLKVLIRQNRRCKRVKSPKENALCLRDLGSMLKRYLEFEDFKKIVGSDNYLVHGTINGFRKRSEVLSDTIHSHGIGKIYLHEAKGIIDRITKKTGIQKGELLGLWFREPL